MATEATTKVKSLRLREHEVRALLRDGRALMVRVMKTQPIDEGYRCEQGVSYPELWAWIKGDIENPATLEIPGLPFACPFGRVGEQRWCQEPFYDRGDYSTLGKYMTNRYVYKADETHSGWILHQAGHMPRSVSRLTVEVAAVRCKRVQSITEDEAKAAGAWLRNFQDGRWSGWGAGANEPEPAPRCYSRRDGFRYDHEARYGPDAWASNPWVWLGDVRKVEG